MKTINIAHLYYDLMNLYGENGNIKALAKALAEQKVAFKIDYLSLANQIDFQKYDLFYIGMGSDNNLMLVLSHLKKYQIAIKETIAQEKFFIVTGNALDLFARSIVDQNNNITRALAIFNDDAIAQKERSVGERNFNVPFIKQKIIGFENCQTKLLDSLPLIKINNFYGTHLIGPLLIRNPYFTAYLIKELLKKHQLPYKTVKKDISYQAYEEYLKNFVNLKQP